MTDEASVANDQKKSVVERDYIPMAMGVEKLAVPEKPGFHRRWFRDNPGRILRAQRAGYQFVQQGEVDVVNTDLGGDAKNSGSTDLGTRVSVVSGEGISEVTGQPNRLILMEIPLDLYQLSRKVVEERNDTIADALTGRDIENDETQYLDKVRTKVPDFFKKKKPKLRG